MLFAIFIGVEQLSAMLVSIRISNGVQITNETNDKVIANHFVSEKELQAEFILAPDGDSKLEHLGFVRINVAASPKELPDLPLQQLGEYLARSLAKMLVSKRSPS